MKEQFKEALAKIDEHARTYSQANFADGLPLGLHYTQHRVMGGLSRQLTKSFAAAVRYSFFSYDEPSGGHFNDFTGHGIFAIVTARWP